MRVLFATTELYPYAKTGGLGDVAAALPPALKKTGIDVRVILPGYASVMAALKNAREIVSYAVYFGMPDFRIVYGKLGEHDAYVLDCPGFYQRPSLYVDEQGHDYKDNHLRYAALCRAAVDLADVDADWKADVIHANDWQGGLIPLYLKTKRSDVKSVITIHNIAYQGLFPPEIMMFVGVPGEYYNADGAEFYNKVGYLKAGLAYADHITTVSPTYAAEIQNAEQGCGLDGFLRTRSKDITGIVNGIDLAVWDPAKDKDIDHHYDRQNLSRKNANKTGLLKQFGLKDADRPLFGIVSRFGYQKGFDIFLDGLAYLIQQGGNVVILGSGDQALEDAFEAAAVEYPGRIGVHVGYDEILAHKIIAGSDVIIMPSRSEPCGLVQLYAMRYGTLPFVHRTGGLADTVIDDGQGGDTGFVFDTPDGFGFTHRLGGIFETYSDAAAWAKLQNNAMSRDSSWESSAQEYVSVYRKVTGMDAGTPVTPDKLAQHAKKI